MSKNWTSINLLVSTTSFGRNYHYARLTNEDTGVEDSEVQCQGPRAAEQWSRDENQAVWPHSRAVLVSDTTDSCACHKARVPSASPLPARRCPLTPKFRGQRKDAKETHTIPYEVLSPASLCHSYVRERTQLVWVSSEKWTAEGSKRDRVLLSLFLKLPH